MASVKPVEYKKDSSTAGFAVAGDKKTITASNANTIQKDIDQGFVNPLDAAQEHQLDKYVDEDTLDYSDEELKNTGKQQINTENTENTDGRQTAGSMAGGAAAAAVSILFAKDVATAINSRIKSTTKSPWVGLANGAYALLAAGLTMASVAMFDNQFKARKEQEKSSGATNDMMNQYGEEINANMETMVGESEEYQELCTANMETTVDTITEIGALQANMHMYLAEGDTARAAEMQAQIDKLQEENEDDGTLEGMQTCKDNLEIYRGKNAEAIGVAESGAVVSEFLRDGKQMGILGGINTLFLGVAAGFATAQAVGIWAGVKWAWDVAPAIAGAVLFSVAAGLMLASAGAMGTKTIEEFKCADKGKEMEGVVNTLNKNVASGEEFIGTTESGYVEADAVAAETTQEAQEGTDKAVENTAKGAGAKAGAKDDKKKPEEEPIVTTAPPSGAAA